MTEYVDFVFAEVPNTPDLLFVEVEDKDGKSVDFGTWARRADGYLVLRVPLPESEGAEGV
jgi:hypothetical protein